MSDSKADLPDFAHPPVIEVALSVHFEPLPELRIAHMGLLWNAVRDRYPGTQELAPISNVVEGFEPGKGNVQVTFASVPQVRVWFVSEDGANLVQIQQDRFARNWRGKGEDYPRYEKVRKDFEEDYRLFQEFVSAEKLGVLKPIQAEVTYVNHVFAGDEWAHHGEAHKVFRVCSFPDLPSEPELEDYGFALRYRIPDESNKPIGRLHVNVSSAYKGPEQLPLFVMQMTARGKFEGDSLESVQRFHDLGREWIVRRFAALTTDKMQRIWGRKDVH